MRIYHIIYTVHAKGSVSLLSKGYVTILILALSLFMTNMQATVLRAPRQGVELMMKKASKKDSAKVEKLDTKTVAKAKGNGFFKGLLGKTMSLFKKNGSQYDNPKVMGLALAELYHQYQENADTIAKEISACFPKDPAMQVEIARAYFANCKSNYLLRQTVRDYLNKALAINPNFSAAFELKGESYGSYDEEKKQFVIYPQDADSACYWYDKAIAADPKKPSPYLKYAEAQSWNNMDAAVAKLEELRKVRPDYNVDLAIAELYDKKVKERSHTEEEAASYRVKSDSIAKSLDPRRLTANQLTKFAMNAYWNNNTEKAEELATIGAERFPHLNGYYRVVGWAAARNGNYTKSLQYLDKFYSLVPKDSVEKLDLRSMDYLSYGISYLNLQRYNEAVKAFDDALATNDDYTSQMPPQINSAWNGTYRKLIAEKKYDDAIDMYPRFIATLPDSVHAEKWGYMYDQFLFRIGEASDEDKKDLLKYMDKLMVETQSRYPDYDKLLKEYYYVMVYTQQLYDASSTEGTAVPYAEKLITLTPSGRELTESEKSYVSTAYDIIAFYELKGKNNMESAVSNWQKALRCNPDDTQAFSILSQLNKLPSAGGSKKKKK